MDLFRQVLAGGAGGEGDDADDGMEEEALLAQEGDSSSSQSSSAEEEEEGEHQPNSRGQFDVSLPARHLVRLHITSTSLCSVYTPS